MPVFLNMTVSEVSEASIALINPLVCIVAVTDEAELIGSMKRADVMHMQMAIATNNRVFIWLFTSSISHYGYGVVIFTIIS